MGLEFYEGKPKENKGFFSKVLLFNKFLHKIGVVNVEKRIGFGDVFLVKEEFWQM